MSRYILRLDDACEKRNIEKWDRMEALLDRYEIKPLVGVIPHCEDPMMDEYPADENFWERVEKWRKKGWTIAMHGYNHVYSTECGGLNPVNNRSEFAGEPLAVQREKVRRGVSVMREHGIDPQVFFAPSHTFDENTLKALTAESNIRIISDTVANKPYCKSGITFVPQQSGGVRKLPFHTVTFCYHPNGMTEQDFVRLERFLNQYRKSFSAFPTERQKRHENLYDRLLQFFYFLRR